MIITLKPEFYPYIGDRDFTRDWNAELARWKQFRHPILMLRAKAWERDKDAMRKWWFSLSRREQHYWLGLRNDGEFSNVLMEAGFKGPKRQRGMFNVLMTSSAQTSGSVLDLDAANNSAFNLDVSPPGMLEAGFTILRDGTHDRINNSGTNQINNATDWIMPQNGTVGDAYEVRWQQIIGSTINNESYTENVWTTISASRRVSMLRQLTSVQNTFDIDIGDVGTSTSLITQDYLIESGDII